MDEPGLGINRLRFPPLFSATAGGYTLLPGALAAVAKDANEITRDMLESAGSIAGISFTDEELDQVRARRPPADDVHSCGVLST